MALIAVTIVFTLFSVPFFWPYQQYGLAVVNSSNAIIMSPGLIYLRAHYAHNLGSEAVAHGPLVSPESKSHYTSGAMRTDNNSQRDILGDVRMSSHKLNIDT